MNQKEIKEQIELARRKKWLKKHKYKITKLTHARTTKTTK